MKKIIICLWISCLFVPPSLAEEKPSPFMQAFMQAESLMEKNQFPQAAQIFEWLLLGEKFNPFGRLIIYWNLYLCYRVTANEKQYDSLFGFLTTYHVYRSMFSDKSIQEFNLHNKITMASTELYIHWMRRNPSFGRIKLFPFPLYRPDSIGIMAERLPFCRDLKNIDKLKHEMIPKNLLKISITCKDKTVETYFFKPKIQDSK